MMAPAGVELEMLVSEPDALTTRPPPKKKISLLKQTSSTISNPSPHCESHVDAFDSLIK